MNSENKLKFLYNEIVSLKSYRPSIKVNKLFSSLVKEALKTNVDNVLNERELSRLQLACSRSEYELERYWAEKILKSDSPIKTIENFPYINNYRKLTKIEWYSFLSCTNHSDHKILFVGGGPLPMTAIVLATSYGLKVTILEKDLTAVKVSTELVSRLKLNALIRVVNIDAQNFKNYKDYNVIAVAALAGTNKTVKRNILSEIKVQSNSNSHILARSSWGLRKILYRPIDNEILQMFEREIEVRPHNDVVNSVFILKT